MKKRIGLLLVALALVVAALANRPAEAAACVRPACPNSVSCCNASECVAWCQSIHGGQAGCLKLSTNGGGCCVCRPLEG